MKKRILASFSIIVVASLLSLTGCGDKKENKDSVNRSGNGRGGGQSGPSSQGSAATTGGQQGNQGSQSPATVNQNPGAWGNIIPQTATAQYPIREGGQVVQQALDNDVTRYFLSTDLEPQIVGGTTQSQDVKFQNLPNCFRSGVHCDVVVSMALTIGNVQSLSTALSSNSSLPITQGTVTIIVYDSLVGATIDDSSEPVTPFPIYLNLNPTNSYIRKNQLVAQFADKLGTVTFSGNINGPAVTGTVDFANTRNVTGNGGASGRLGSFQINTCSIFTQQCY
jgi:hypothetical protein